MYKYMKKLNYPINIKKKNLKMAKCLITQLGGPLCKTYNGNNYGLQILYTKNK